MPLVGFLCPLNGQKVKLDTCATCTIGEDVCDPALNAAIIDSVRPVEKDVFSTTELLNPRQCLYLERNNDYYATPDSQLWALYGSAIHSIIEKGLDKYNLLLFKNRFRYEEQHRTKINGATLRGTFDKYDTLTKTITDWKTVKYYYTGKYLMEGKWGESTHREQQNIYRTFFLPEAEHMKLKLLIRDHNSQLRRKGIPDKVTLTVPRLDDDKVRELVSRRINESLDDQLTGNPPPCEEKDLWKGRARCKDYCGGRDFCEQFKQWQKDNEYEEV